MEFDDDEYGFAAGFPPALVSLTPFASTISPSPRRLSSCFTKPAEAVRSKRRLAWVSLQGRLVGADEASSAKAVDPNGAFTTEEAAAWELFTPVQRVLTVAVVGAAAANSKKDDQISKLQKSVELRDQVLSSMQKKLDDLCEQLNYCKDQPEVETKTVECGCKLYPRNNHPQSGSLFNTSTKGSNEDQAFKYQMPISNEAEPDERRMSDLSDWAPSVASSIDIQLDSLALDHDINSLRKECDQKDVTIKELSTFLRSSEVLSSKRIVELEDIIRRKNMIINKLRKDMIVLEQKVVNLTRRRRPSFSAASSDLQHLPTLTDNVVYDMDSTTDPSSSDSDSNPRNRTQAPFVDSQQISVEMSEKDLKGDMKCDHAKSSPFVHQNPSSLATTAPLKENSFNQTPNSVPPSKSKHTTNASGENRSRRRPPIKSKEVAAQKRWI
ncbi:hypothetical protein C2S51_022728 [Perilla frutescens var. frutescens]|nr:hypothetical protein C2S51_022728 [Perilla frutescens var. frutescens]